jgi:hypothetical protein
MKKLWKTICKFVKSKEMDDIIPILSSLQKKYLELSTVQNTNQNRISTILQGENETNMEINDIVSKISVTDKLLIEEEKKLEDIKMSNNYLRQTLDRLEVCS